MAEIVLGFFLGVFCALVGTLAGVLSMQSNGGRRKPPAVFHAKITPRHKPPKEKPKEEPNTGGPPTIEKQLSDFLSYNGKRKVGDDDLGAF